MYTDDEQKAIAALEAKTKIPREYAIFFNDKQIYISKAKTYHSYTSAKRELHAFLRRQLYWADQSKQPWTQGYLTDATKLAKELLDDGLVEIKQI